MIDLCVSYNIEFKSRIVNNLHLAVDGQSGLLYFFLIAMSLGNRGSFYTDTCRSTLFQGTSKYRKQQFISSLITYYHHQKSS